MPSPIFEMTSLTVFLYPLGVYATGMRKLLLLAAGAVIAVALWWRRNPSACPYNQRFWVQAPHPLITRPRLREALAPVPGERILEVGPGTGYYALPVAEWLGS